jgi:hypothetical protein
VIVTPSGERWVAATAPPSSDPVRGTFCPANSEEFMAAKRAGIFGNAAEVVPETRTVGENGG